MINTLRILLFLQLLCTIFVDSQQSGFIPKFSFGDTASLIDNQIFIIGDSNIFYLDLSMNFSTGSPPFVPVQMDSPIPFVRYAASAVSSKDSGIWIFGGEGVLPTRTNRLLYVQPKSSSWSLISATGSPPTSRESMSTVIDSDGKLYIWGGIMQGEDDKAMYVFDTTTAVWSRLLPNNAPEPRASYTATLLSDGRIIYIGGILTDIRQILIFDTKNSQWSFRTATNSTPVENREGHSAVLAPDGMKIIILGGIEVVDQLLELDLTTFNFRVPYISSPFDFSPYDYTATLYGNYMIVTADSRDSNPISLLDLSNNNLKWTTSFVVPPQPINSPPTITPTIVNDANTGTIVGAAVGSLVGGMAIAAIAYLGYKKYQNSRNQTTHAPSDSTKVMTSNS